MEVRRGRETCEGEEGTVSMGAVQPTNEAHLTRVMEASIATKVYNGGINRDKPLHTARSSPQSTAWWRAAGLFFHRESIPGFSFTVTIPAALEGLIREGQV